MIYLGLGLGLLIGRIRLISLLLQRIRSHSRMNWNWFYWLTLSLNQNYYQVYLLHRLNRLFESTIVLSLVAGASQILIGQTRWLSLVIIAMILVTVLSFINQMKQQQLVLLERLQLFLYYYEMELMRGTHQLRALREADRRTGLYGHYETVTDYITATNTMYGHVRWLIVKKLAILLERNQSFSNMDLTIDFIELTQELQQRYAQSQRLRLERRENMMILPMIFNLILMIMYLMAPFLQDFMQ